MMKKLPLVLLTMLSLSLSLGVFGEDYYEFNDANPMGIFLPGGKAAYSLVSEGNGNQCLRIDIKKFKGNGSNRMLDFCLFMGKLKLEANKKYTYEISLKGNMPGSGFITVWDVTGKNFWKDRVEHKKGGTGETMTVTPEQWTTYSGAFTPENNTKEVSLRIFYYRNIPEDASPENYYLLIDKIRVADEAGNNMYTLRSFLSPEQQKVEPKGDGEYLILFKGNSITRHGFNSNTITRLGWDHVAGMAASNEELDFSHQLEKMIQKALPDKKVRIAFGAGNQWVLDDLPYTKVLKPDLIVYQSGEHVTKKEGFPAYEKLLNDCAAEWGNLAEKPQIIYVGVWAIDPNSKEKYRGYSAEVEAIQRTAAEKAGIGFVSVAPYALDPTCSGWGTSGGVKWHPNDKGMLKYAEGIFTEWHRMRVAQ